MKKGRGRLIEAPGLDPDRPLNEQIAAHLRGLIQTGAIAPGARLPGQRMLAADLKVSRNTVLSVLAQLTSEGLVETRLGSGTYVAEGIAPQKRLAPAPEETDTLLPLNVGAAVDLFPMAAWSKLQAKRWRKLPPTALGEGDAAGWHGLRALIAQRLGALRGVDCEARQVVIVPSAQVAVELAARALAAPNEVAWVEDPGYWRGRDAVKNAGLRPAPCSVDGEGFDVTRARAQVGARLAVVTPARQFPTGVAMSAVRRAALIAWARGSEGWIVEDDYESEFCFDGRPPRALAAEAPERVVYVSSFSPVLFPAMRVAYLVAPAAVADKFVALRARSDRMMNTPLQIVLQDFMEGGGLAAHVRACREIYAERRAVLLAALQARLDAEIRAPAIGLHLVALLRDGESDLALQSAATNLGVVTSALSAHALLPTQPGLFLGFAAYKPSEIERAVERLAAAQASVRA
jgi:GntR family transcriptional regulator/MocR family aminotransferase